MNLGRAFTLQYDATIDVFRLLDPGGTEIRTGASSRALSKWAFENGADSVRHDYHLGVER